ncbi:hypothetical protein G3N55_00600 [Dissulfurirhabdus thermomarina]|uniref:Uncharacterized protein n=1 Tax=Dissulfurirhabdus thermomarina TaxID=1765737 RepID=A0A6N9TLP6_DISTH|nr:hypothetical protein [Dissulfurirhabdus thermomarina]NDY41350.1 hypothetical protein [Dissulfurirhabdus thermomarina]NMX23267.1 hypothetical protein [Dissulfurirhabdus thermomarina]
MPEAKDFLSPHSMLTPGIAGAITTGVALPVVNAFDLKYKWVALAVGFLLALLIVLRFKDGVSRLERAIYCILNTLIIFSVSVGAGVNLDSPPRAKAAPMPPAVEKILERYRVETPVSRLRGWFEPRAAHVQPAGGEGAPGANATVGLAGGSGQPPLSPEEIRQLQDYVRQQKALEEEQRRYNQRWSW